jgi:hypothetical protein
MPVKVKNINGTTDNTCACGSWLEHWKKFSNVPLEYCSEQSCAMVDLVGAHVMKAYGDDDNWYIIPLCKRHNKLKGQDLDVVVSTVFVPANTKETCEKKEENKVGSLMSEVERNN